MTDLEQKEAVPEIVPEVGVQGAELLEALLDKGRVIAHGIFFDVDSHTLRSESFTVLHEIGRMLQASPDLRVVIEGHTDSTGRASWNQALSERRADSVRRFLIDNHGIDPGRLESVGYGQERPADTNETAAGRQNNRRVELVRVTP
jgi:OmpA-OmpF porin, OOP family